MKRLTVSLVISTLFYVLLLFPSDLSTTSYKRIQVWTGPGELVEYISETYNRPYYEVVRIVRYAFEQSENNKGFPSAYDILAVMGVESSFNPAARGPGGLGLMQVNPTVFTTIPGLADINTNISTGHKILQEYRTIAKTDAHALVYYNAGPTGGRNICPARTCNTPYTEKVARLKYKLLKYSKKELTCSRLSSSFA